MIPANRVELFAQVGIVSDELAQIVYQISQRANGVRLTSSSTAVQVVEPPLCVKLPRAEPWLPPRTAMRMLPATIEAGAAGWTVVLPVVSVPALTKAISAYRRLAETHLSSPAPRSRRPCRQARVLPGRRTTRPARSTARQDGESR